VESDLRVRLREPHRREDRAIERAVDNALDLRSSLSGGDRSVTVEDGWASLGGSVRWQYQRSSALDNAQNLTGAMDVTDDRSLDLPVSATAVKNDIELALARAAANDARKIHVEIQGSSVKLTGNVRSAAERHAATQSALATPGVTNVIDQMVEPY
jgi:osmotically-inducible protein OsmY